MLNDNKTITPESPFSLSSLGPWIILLSMVLLVLLINVDYTAVNIAMIAIAEEVNVELNTLQWLLSGYMLAWASLVIPAGQLADIYGKRRILLIGVTLFMMASILCGLVSSAELLITARVLQGFGGALFVPPLYALTFETFPPEKRGFAIGMMGVGAGIGLAIGPSFGGFLLEYWGWRWIFLINVPLCLIPIGIILALVDREPRRISSKKIDIGGSLLLGSALAIGIFSLNQTEVWGLEDHRIWILFALSLALAIGFIFSLKRNKENRLIPKGLFRNKAFLGTMIGFSIYAFCFSVILVIIGLYLQNVLGYDAYGAGNIFLAMTIAMGILSPYGGKLTDTMDARIPICGGLGLLTFTLMAAGFMDETTSLYYILPLLLTIGLGMGLCFPALNATMMKTVDPAILSTASGTFVMSTCASNTIGVVVSTSLLVGLGQGKLNRLIEQGTSGVDTQTYQSLTTLLSSAYRDMALLSHRSTADIQTFIAYLNESFIWSMGWIMGLSAILTGIACFVSYKTVILGKKKNEI